MASKPVPRPPQARQVCAVCGDPHFPHPPRKAHAWTRGELLGLGWILGVLSMVASWLLGQVIA